LRGHRFWGALLILGATTAQAAEPEESEVDVPTILPPREDTNAGRIVRRVELRNAAPGWDLPKLTPSLKVGSLFEPGLARKAARELAETGGVAEVTIETEAEGDGVVVRLIAMPQRVIRAVRVQSALDLGDSLRALGLETGRGVTPATLEAARSALQGRARARGYPQARVQLTTRDTDNPLAVLVLVELSAGEPRRIDGIRTEVHGTELRDELRELLRGYPLRAGMILDEEVLREQDRVLQGRLQAGGFHQAQVEHRVYELGTATYVLLSVRPGPLFRLRFEGNKLLDGDHLAETLDLEHESERSLARAAQKIREEYQRLGFLDAEVTGQELGAPEDPVHDLFFQVRENQRTRVVARRYPCLPAGEGRTPRELDREIDSFLEEELPGATLLGAVNPGLLDRALGPTGITGARPSPLPLDPSRVYVADVYDRAMKHLRDLYRSEGYLAASVGPVQVLRARCSPHSPPNRCTPLPLPTPADRCTADPLQVPLEEPPLGPEFLCKPDPRKNITCAPEIELRIPVKPGPRATIHDVVFEHATAFPETLLLKISGLRPGEWASNVKIEEGRRALLDHYKEEGFAYADVEASVELSPDKKLARVRFTLHERQQVRVDRILIQGNTRTQESVIRDRLRLSPDGLYRQSAVRRSEEQLATLGIFSTVSVGLEDPAVPATRKNVLVTVVERSPQYLEMRPGLSTGEGYRTLLEYGHRNLGGLAIQFTFRIQLSYLPDAFIPDERVRANFERLPLGERLERRNSASFQFPNVFHPTIRLGLDAIDVRSNSRDFGLTKDALLPSLTWSPVRQLSATLGLSAELNDVRIFSGDSIVQYLQQPGVTNDLSRLLRVPDGETTALGQRVSVVWDRRDNPLGATRGTLVAGSVEHVRAFPAEDNPNTTTSDFLRFNGRVGAYWRLNDSGLVLAGTLGAGVNRQLISGSKTYPDRLFFLGGVDSIRGFLRDALVPQDIADKITEDSAKDASDPSRLTIDKVAIRGGDVFLNPRVEFRIPLSGPLETALFLDSGNLWVEPRQIDPFRLRYTGGSGLRFATPVGPVAIDYGLNLRRRSWEERGAFHFSIGLFLARQGQLRAAAAPGPAVGLAASPSRGLSLALASSRCYPRVLWLMPPRRLLRGLLWNLSAGLPGPRSPIPSGPMTSPAGLSPRTTT
jgi:outer membrane protein assembly factor BamA